MPSIRNATLFTVLTCLCFLGQTVQHDQETTPVTSNAYANLPTGRLQALQLILSAIKTWEHNRLLKNPTTIHPNNETIRLLHLILLLSGDVECNPGPRPPRFPCGICMKAVRKQDTGIFCEECKFWHHTKCIDMSLREYENLGNSDDDWFCFKCSLPQFTDSFFEDPRETSSLAESLLSDNHNNEQDESQELREGEHFPELIEVRKSYRNNFIAAHLNINSIQNKFEEIKEVLQTQRLLDFMAIAETKLDPSYPASQFQVQGYRQYRLDRDSHGSGLLIYIRDDIASRHRSELQPDDLEAIVTGVTNGKDKWMFITAYRPPSSNQTSMTRCLLP